MKHFWLSGAGGILCVLVACGPVQDTAPKSIPANTAKATPTTINPQLIELVDGKMERSKAFRIDGDLRPIWTVSGRIKNWSPWDIKSVTIRIDISSRGSSQVVDQATLQIDADIPSESIGSFSREIQILPPNTAWQWSYEVVNVVPK
jgi:hypothetical protein